MRKESRKIVLIGLFGGLLFVGLLVAYDACSCWAKMKIMEYGGDYYQDAATDKQWKKYINKKYHFDPPVCTNSFDN